MKRSTQSILATGLAVLVSVSGMTVAPVYQADASVSSPSSCGLKVYKGNNENGVEVAMNAKQLIPLEAGSIDLFASEAGKWKIVDQATGKKIDEDQGQAFQSITLAKGTYTLSFSPKNATCGDWQMTVVVNPVEVFSNMAGSAQKLTQNQKVTIADLNTAVVFTSSSPGKWWTAGVDQTTYEASSFSFTVPPEFSGMSIPVMFQPNGGDESSIQRFLVEAGPAKNTCTPKLSTLTMDVVEQRNEGSTPTEEKSDLASDSSTRFYQDPLYKLWVTRNADAIIRDRVTYDERDPGYWVVNNAVATDERLNWNHTALNLASYGAGTYKVMYVSKTDSTRKWCGEVKIVQDSKPASTKGTCDWTESGSAPEAKELQLKTSKGVSLKDKGRVTIDKSDLRDYRELALSGTHVSYEGMAKKRKDKAKTNVRYLYLPKLEWKTETMTFGEKRLYSGGTLTSSNQVEVLFNDKTVLVTFDPKLNRDGSEGLDGEETLNLAKIINDHGNKPGKYTIRVKNELGYQTCEYESTSRGYNKLFGQKQVTQTFSTTIVLK
ncbi:MAG: hypothetical protein ACM32O_04530 [Clostridia bacterium]